MNASRMPTGRIDGEPGCVSARSEDRGSLCESWRSNLAPRRKDAKIGPFAPLRLCARYWGKVTMAQTAQYNPQRTMISTCRSDTYPTTNPTRHKTSVWKRHKRPKISISGRFRHWPRHQYKPKTAGSQTM